MLQFWSYFGFWPFPSKHWNSHLISFSCKEYWNSGPKHWNFDLIRPIIGFFYDYNPSTANIVILVLSLYTLEFLSYPFTANVEILAQSFQTLEFWSYFYKHGSCHLFLPNTWILALFLYFLAVGSYPSKHWDTISISIGIMILSLETLEFWLYFYIHWNSYLPLADNIGILSLFL